MIVGAWVATRNLDIPLRFACFDKFKHLIVFMGFSFLIDLATARQPFWLWKASLIIMYGLVIDILQYFSQGRTFSIWDWMADNHWYLFVFIGKNNCLPARFYKL